MTINSLEAASFPEALAVAACLVAGLLLTSHAQAQSMTAYPENGTEPWDVNLGGGVAVGPAYPGAKRYKPLPAPMISATYRDTVFFNSMGIGVNAVNINGFRAGPILSYFMGRDHTDEARIGGLKDISMSIAGGGFMAYRFGPIEISGMIRQAMTHASNGLLGTVQINYRGQITPRASFEVGPDLELGNHAYEQTWFGVTETQSARSGLPVYRAHGGIQSVGGHASVSYALTRTIVLRTFISAKQLVSDAADSPIVERKTQVLGGIGAIYRF